MKELESFTLSGNEMMFSSGGEDMKIGLEEFKELVDYLIYVGESEEYDSDEKHQRFCEELMNTFDLQIENEWS